MRPAPPDYELDFLRALLDTNVQEARLIVSGTLPTPPPLGGGKPRSLTADDSELIRAGLCRRRVDFGARSARYCPGVARVHFGPARMPSRESPEAAVELLLERGYDACEIDFE